MEVTVVLPCVPDTAITFLFDSIFSYNHLGPDIIFFSNFKISLSRLFSFEIALPMT